MCKKVNKKVNKEQGKQKKKKGHIRKLKTNQEF